MRKLCNLSILIILIVSTSIMQAQRATSVLPTASPVKLQSYTKIDFPLLKEASGLVKSRQLTDVFWTHNDSGDEARIFPINREGKLLKPDWMNNYVGIQIPDAVNVDWEAITIDDSGNLFIADFGNNANARKDLAIYIVKEPLPWETVTTRVYRRILFYYPDQKEFPAKNKNYDAEAMFWLKGFVYILTKHRSDSSTKLYRIDPSIDQVEVAAEFVEQYNIQARVTGADIDSTGNNLVVLTETSIWFFERDLDTQKFFGGKKLWLPHNIPQAEAVSFDGLTILILNEYGELFKINSSDFYRVDN